MVITLSGFMGSGKSTVGSLLADALHLPFVDLDQYIESSEGIDIPKIFSLVGESCFRAMELSALLEVMGNVGKCVLALGGGTLTAPGCLSIVKGSTFNIYLKATPETLAARLEGEREHRPLLQGDEPLAERISSLLEARSAAYAEAARLTVETDGLSPDQIVDTILDALDK